MSLRHIPKGKGNGHRYTVSLAEHLLMAFVYAAEVQALLRCIGILIWASFLHYFYSGSENV